MCRVMATLAGVRTGLVAVGVTVLVVSAIPSPAVAANTLRVEASYSTVFGEPRGGISMRDHHRVHRTLCTGADFRHADLPGTGLSGSELSGADFTGANLVGSTFAVADLSFTCFIEANLAGATMSLANLTGADFTDANLAGATLTGADLTDADFTGALIEGAVLVGVIIDGTIGLKGNANAPTSAGTGQVNSNLPLELFGTHRGPFEDTTPVLALAGSPRLGS